MRQALAAFCCATVFVVLAAAQTQNTASLIVTVVDANGALLPERRSSVANNATGASREAVADSEGSAVFPALSLTGTTKSPSRSPDFFRALVRSQLRAGETAAVKVGLQVNSGITRKRHSLRLPLKVFEPTRRSAFCWITNRSTATPILGRKTTTLPLLNSAFRQGKGTGDLFVNQTYFITGVGSRRATTFTIDGASNDEGWGRQTLITTVPLAAIQEADILTNAFSAEYGWTSGPAFNIVTKSGTNAFHGQGIFMLRPGDGWQAKSFSTKNFCPGSVPSCVVPSTLQAINPIDIPDQLTQYSGAIGGPIIKDKTFFFVAC
jgi:hypothetical protein